MTCINCGGYTDDNGFCEECEVHTETDEDYDPSESELAAYYDPERESWRDEATRLQRLK